MYTREEKQKINYWDNKMVAVKSVQPNIKALEPQISLAKLRVPVEGGSEKVLTLVDIAVPLELERLISNTKTGMNLATRKRGYTVEGSGM